MNDEALANQWAKWIVMRCSNADRPLHDEMVHRFCEDLRQVRDAERAELAEAKEELNWQNNRNAGSPTKGGFEFYINEEWTGLAEAALDADYGWCAALRKHRIDPDDERVRVRRVVEDDAILAQLASAQQDKEMLDWLEKEQRLLAFNHIRNVWVCGAAESTESARDAIRRSMKL